MTSDDAETLGQASFHNRARMSAQTACGCYSCLTVFTGADIKHWTDDGATACCPVCDIDAVLPEVTNKSVLTDLRAYWFSAVPVERTHPTI
jgi:hypothetical protein